MDNIPQQLILQLCLILLNAFFAMTEIAVISLSPTRLRKLAEDGDKLALRLLRMVERKPEGSSTILRSFGAILSPSSASFRIRVGLREMTAISVMAKNALSRIRHSCKISCWGILSKKILSFMVCAAGATGWNRPKKAQKSTASHRWRRQTMLCLFCGIQFGPRRRCPKSPYCLRHPF